VKIVEEEFSVGSWGSYFSVGGGGGEGHVINPEKDRLTKRGTVESAE